MFLYFWKQLVIFYNCSVSSTGFFLQTLTLGFPLLTVFGTF